MGPLLADIIGLYRTAATLKELPRQGWIMEGAPRAEADSVAGHSFCVALLSYFVAHALVHFQGIALDKDKVLRMAIFHDLGEAATGEIATAVMTSLPAETLRETEYRLVTALLEGLPAALELEQIIREYDAGVTDAALVVKFADVLDAFGHAKDRLHTAFPEYLERRLAWFQAKAQGGSRTADVLTQWLRDVLAEWPDRKRPWAASGCR